MQMLVEMPETLGPSKVNNSSALVRIYYKKREPLAYAFRFNIMIVQDAPNNDKFDQRDTLILALSALLRAERQTRFAFEACLGAGVLKLETLQAMVSDPVPVVTQEDINYAELVAVRATHVGGNS